MKVVVTGATGVIGSYLVPLLRERGATVLAVSRQESLARQAPDTASGGLPDLLSLDLTDDACVDRLAAELGSDVAVVHLAEGRASVTGPSALERRRLVELNALGTLRLLDGARRSRARVVVYASTSEVYAGSRSGAALAEAAPTSPRSEYAATKLAGEDHLFAFAKEERIRVIALRFAEVYGARAHANGVLGGYLAAMARGERPRVSGDPNARHDLVHASDAAAAISSALACEYSGIVNVSDGVARSCRELAAIAAKTAGLSGEPEELAGAHPAEPDLHLEIALAQRELGFSPRVDVLAGAREHLAWLKGRSEVPR